jgi:hypothetical protein
MAPLRPRSAKGSPRWTIRAASFSSPFAGGIPRPFISPSNTPSGTPRYPSKTASRLGEVTAELTVTPEKPSQQVSPFTTQHPVAWPLHQGYS